RVIHFTGEALEMVRAAVARGPDALLFPNSKGRRYAKGSVQSLFNKLRDRLGVPRLTAYSYRHTLATAWLMAGKSVEARADLLGNPPQPIHKHYSHICQRRDGVRQQLEDFKSAAGKR